MDGPNALSSALHKKSWASKGGSRMEFERGSIMGSIRGSITGSITGSKVGFERGFERGSKRKHFDMILWRAS